MLLQRFYDETLAQASYLIGCQATGEALVIDANRDVEQYITALEKEQLRLTQVTETHIHADYLSGSRELAARTGARLLLSDEGGDEWRYGFAAADRAALLHDGDVIRVGNIRVQVLHTPGHTPEHVSFLLTDGAATDRPMGVFTGDFVFVGDVGRPDLLERAAKYQGTMEASARTLFRSIQRFRSLPDYLQIWPGHGAGSACGKALGAVPSTTLGYEKIANWAFGVADEDEFVRQVLAGQPEPPRYFAVMKRLNRDGPAMRPDRAVAARRVNVEAIERARSAGQWIVDTRLATEYAEGFVPGTINIPLNKAFTNWAGSLLPYDADLLLVATDQDSARRATELMQLIGLDRVVGWAGPDTIAAWVAAQPGRELEMIPQTNPREAAARPDARIIDVRSESEWLSGHIPGASHHFLGDLLEESREIPRDAPVIVQCQTGSRSAIASSLLRFAGFRDVSNMAGGITAWREAGLPVEQEESEVAR